MEVCEKSRLCRPSHLLFSMIFCAGICHVLLSDLLHFVAKSGPWLDPHGLATLPRALKRLNCRAGSEPAANLSAILLALADS